MTRMAFTKIGLSLLFLLSACAHTARQQPAAEGFRVRSEICTLNQEEADELYQAMYDEKFATKAAAYLETLLKTPPHALRVRYGCAAAQLASGECPLERTCTVIVSTAMVISDRLTAHVQDYLSGNLQRLANEQD